MSTAIESQILSGNISVLSSPKQRKWEQSETDRLLQKASKSIKRELLASPKKGDISISPTQSIMLTTLRGSQNFFIFDEPAIEKIKHIDTQRERRKTQESLQMIYNRVLLLEKEDRKAMTTVSQMQRTTMKILEAKRSHAERLQLNEISRNQKERDSQMKLASNCFSKNQLRSCISSSINNSVEQIKKKAELMKQIQQQTKNNLIANNEMTLLQKEQQFNNTRTEEKNNRYRRLVSADIKRRQALEEHHLKCHNENMIKASKQQEYQMLEEKEKQLLAQLQSKQMMFDQSVADMRKVISSPVSPNNPNSDQEILEIKKSILKNYDTTNSSNVSLLVQAADTYLNRINHQPKVATFSFKTSLCPSPRSSSIYQTSPNKTNNKVITSSTIFYPSSDGNGGTTTREDLMVTPEEKKQNSLLQNQILQESAEENEVQLQYPNHIRKTSRKSRTACNLGRQTPNSGYGQSPTSILKPSSPTIFSKQPSNAEIPQTFQNFILVQSQNPTGISLVCPPSNFLTGSGKKVNKM